MNKNMLIAGGLILAALVTLPLVLGQTAGHAEGERRYEDLADRWRNHQVPEYAERMGLNRVSREFFESAPLHRSYDEVMQYLGHAGMHITDPADLPPTDWTANHNYWASRIESPEHDLYMWVNEYDCVMVVIEQDGKIVHSYDGMHPEGYRAL